MYVVSQCNLVSVVLALPTPRDRRLSRPERLVAYRDGLGLPVRRQSATPPSTNRARRRATLLIDATKDRRIN